MEIKIEASWKEVLSDVFKSTYFLQAATHIKTELATGATIFPAGKDIFNAGSPIKENFLMFTTSDIV